MIQEIYAGDKKAASKRMELIKNIPVLTLNKKIQKLALMLSSQKLFVTPRPLAQPDNFTIAILLGQLLLFGADISSPVLKLIADIFNP